MTGSVELRAQARAFVRGLAVNFGAEVVAPPAGPVGGWETSDAGLSEPLAGVRAGRLVGDAARELTVAAARDARAAGRTWGEIGEALGLPATEVPGVLGRAAFEEITGHRPDAIVIWGCTSCRRPIRDYGPYFGDPAQDQDGHTGGCARFTGELATWQARRAGDGGGS